MNKVKILFLSLLIPFGLLGQVQLPYNDTTYFIPFDDDFNLINSASKGHINNVLNLLKRGADIDAVTIDEISSLMYAAENGDLEMVKVLIENGANPNLKPYNDVTALISAAKSNYYSVAEYLIANGAEKNAVDEFGVTALHYAAAFNFVDILKMLIFYDADFNKADKEGTTPLLSAAFNNCPEAVEVLIEANVDINQTDKQGFTALMIATQESNTKVVEILLANGADIGKVNNGGMTALGFAIKGEHYALVEDLIYKGADVNHRITNSQNLLELSKEQEDDNITELLITEGAKANYLPSYTIMTLGTAFIFGNDDFMNSLNYQLVDRKYNTAINLAFCIRPSARRVQTEAVNDTLFQSWERRMGFQAGLEKRLKLAGWKQSQTGPMGGINAFYSFGSYRGSTTKPDPGVILNPYAGWYYTNKTVSLKIQYDYMNFNVPKLSSGRVSIGMGFNFSSSRKKLTQKSIKWLTN